MSITTSKNGNSIKCDVCGREQLISDGIIHGLYELITQHDRWHIVNMDADIRNSKAVCPECVEQVIMAYFDLPKPVQAVFDFNEVIRDDIP